jgi:uncharacterized protein (DUF2141 family)
MSNVTTLLRLSSVTLMGVLVPGVGTVRAQEAARAQEAPQLGSAVVTVDGFRSEKGMARVVLFDQPAGFPSDDAHAVRRAQSKIEAGRIEVRFDSLPLGVYAVAVHHDENGDGKMNKGLFGIPKEGYAVSNNVVKRRAPKFEEAEFRLDRDLMPLEIHVRY